MPQVQEILSLMHSPSREDRELIQKAYNFAKNAHEGQKRFSGEPYFNHVYETAKILADLGMGARTVAAGLLHDTLEDVEAVTEDTLKKEFGDEILFLVEGVTKLGKVRFHGAERHIESLRKLFVATSQDIRVLIIKLADRLHNMKTLEYVKPEKQKRIAKETMEVYAPIAHRLGMGKLRGELEDLSFPYLYPDQYKKALEISKSRFKESEAKLEKVYKKLQKELLLNGLTDVKTDYRRKHLYSFWKKLQRKDMEVDQIYDILALRVIVPTVSDCYRVLGIIHSIWRPLPGRIKDYIAFPKPNGYRSIHTTIFTGDGGIAEIQIRTEEMHREAEYGIASHVKYKAKVHKQPSTLEWFRQFLPRLRIKKPEDAGIEHVDAEIPSWVKQLAEVQKDAQGDHEFYENLKSDFMEDRIFVFTPKGDVIDLPVDSSPVDFAYHVHTDIGDHMSGAKVNSKLVSLDTKLKNGDIVEIIIKKSSKPSRKWLQYAKTTFAKRHIRAYLQKSRK